MARELFSCKMAFRLGESPILGVCRVKIGPRWRYDGARLAKMSQNTAKMGQDRPRWAKMKPRWVQDGPRWVKMSQDGAKMRPRLGQDGAKTGQDGAQDEPKRAKHGPMLAASLPTWHENCFLKNGVSPRREPHFGGA